LSLSSRKTEGESWNTAPSERRSGRPSSGRQMRRNATKCNHHLTDPSVSIVRVRVLLNVNAGIVCGESSSVTVTQSLSRIDAA
jgi:hypothetical protein